MGLTIYSKNYEKDIGYGHFNMLRQYCLKYIDAELAEHYSKWVEFDINNKLVKYNEILNDICHKNKLSYYLVEFFCQSDCGGSATVGAVKQLYEKIKDVNSNKKYFFERSHNENDFDDFKLMLQDCIENKCKLKWC